jgi:hypothetical protein
MNVDALILQYKRAKFCFIPRLILYSIICKNHFLAEEIDANRIKVKSSFHFQGIITDSNFN